MIKSTVIDYKVTSDTVEIVLQRHDITQFLSSDAPAVFTDLPEDVQEAILEWVNLPEVLKDLYPRDT